MCWHGEAQEVSLTIYNVIKQFLPFLTVRLGANVDVGMYRKQMEENRHHRVGRWTQRNQYFSSIGYIISSTHVPNPPPSSVSAVRLLIIFYRITWGGCEGTGMGENDEISFNNGTILIKNPRNEIVHIFRVSLLLISSGFSCSGLKY